MPDLNSNLFFPGSINETNKAKFAFVYQESYYCRLRFEKERVRTFGVQIKRIMVVDDNEPDQFYAKIVVRKFDERIEVITAFDGQQALEILSDMEKEPEIIFLDINMPGMDGHDFLKRYSAQSENPCVVIMLSTSEEDRDRIPTEQFDCVKMHLVKPLKPEYLEMLSSMTF